MYLFSVDKYVDIILSFGSTCSFFLFSRLPRGCGAPLAPHAASFYPAATLVAVVFRFCLQLILFCFCLLCNLEHWVFFVGSSCSYALSSKRNRNFDGKLSLVKCLGTAKHVSTAHDAVICEPLNTSSLHGIFTWAVSSVWFITSVHRLYCIGLQAKG